MVTELPSINPAGRFTVIQTAKILGMGRQTVYDRIRRGDIHACSRGDNSRAFIKGVELIRFFNSERP